MRKNVNLVKCTLDFDAEKSTQKIFLQCLIANLFSFR